MSRIFLAAGRYIQGAGAINEIGSHVALMGTCAFAIGGKTALMLCGDAIAESCSAQDVGYCQELFQGVSSRREIERLSAIARAKGADIILALGGGSSIDAGKAVSHEMDLPVVVVPTTAATDGPCSALSVIYTDEGVFEEYLHLRRNPDCVLMDTDIIARSPARFLVAGMGDALAGLWESGTCVRSGRANAFCGGDVPTLTAQLMARLCYRTLLESGFQAKQAVEKNMVTPAVEAVVEANTLMSGLSSENCGHAGAHSIHNGFTTLPLKGMLHGEIVAFGVLAQLVMEGQPQKSVAEVQEFCTRVGLPICLQDLNLESPTAAEIRQVAEASVAAGETIHATWFDVSAAQVEAAIWTADALGQEYKKSLRQRQVPLCS